VFLHILSAHSSLVIYSFQPLKSSPSNEYGFDTLPITAKYCPPLSHLSLSTGNNVTPALRIRTGGANVNAIIIGAYLALVFF